MTIQTVAPPNPQKYTVVCTDKSCAVTLAFDETDINHGTRYSGGRDAGSYEGIVCPHCGQILTREQFKKVDQTPPVLLPSPPVLTPSRSFLDEPEPEVKLTPQQLIEHASTLWRAREFATRWQRSWEASDGYNSPDRDSRAGGITYGRIQGTKVVSHEIGLLIRETLLAAGVAVPKPKNDDDLDWNMWLDNYFS